MISVFLGQDCRFSQYIVAAKGYCSYKRVPALSYVLSVEIVHVEDA